MTSQTRTSDSVPASNDETSRKDKILAVATALFAEKGFAAVRIDEIASAAESNRQLIYYYFQNKAGLYEATLANMVHQVTPLWDEMEADGSVVASVARMLEPTDAGKAWFRLLAWEGLDLAANSGEIHLEERRTQSWARFIGVIRYAQERGELDPGLDTEMVALFLVSFAQAPSLIPQVGRMLTGLDAGSDAFLERYAALLRRLLEGLRPPA